MRSRLLAAITTLFITSGISLIAPTAFAQADETSSPDGDTPTEGDAPAEAEKPSEASSTTAAGSTQANVQVTDPGDIASEAGDSPFEKPGQTYYFVGARYRGIIVPKFMMNLFGDGGQTVYVDNIGVEAAIRKDNFEYVFALSYADYDMEWTPFKASTDPEQAWELVKSEIQVLYATVDFLWSTQFSPQFGMNFGLGAGFGIVWGDLHREQAFRDMNGQYVRCSGPGDARGGNYCGNDNDHYAGYTEPSWSDGGSKPIIFPWLAPMFGFRYKPHRHFVARLDAGFGITGFFLGLGADYGI